ncbi:hypothetical protein JCM14469_36930 [Desulfatiferula olefinivorans]
MTSTHHTRDLHRSLYMEHLEELSMLYDRRCAWPDQPGRPWAARADLEQRCEPHIDAQVIGGEEALLICERQIKAGDDGERYGALRVMCRLGRMDGLRTALDAMDLTDASTLRAAGDALCADLPDSLNDECIRFLLERGPGPIRLAARIIAVRRIDVARDLFDLLTVHAEDRETAAVILHALGRLRPSGGASALRPFLHSTHADVVDAAMFALVRMGERKTLHEAMAVTDTGSRGLFLGLCGARTDLEALLFSLTRTSLSRDHVLGLGLLGNVAAIPELTACLDHPDLAGMAALSLNLITGAGLDEAVFVPDPDDLLDDERKHWEQGLLYPTGEKPGQRIRRISRQPEDWGRWWRDKRFRFDPEMRYRNGRLYSPERLLENLSDPDSPDLIRNLACEELVIRYGIDIPFDTRMPVADQQRAIGAMGARLIGNPDGFVEGLWYDRGKPIPDPVRDAEPANRPSREVIA